MGKVTAVVGAQYGSEGKGNIVKAMAYQYDVHVRTGAPNAGHTIWYEGQQWKMRSVPCGWVNPSAKLIIGAGALIDIELLTDEVESLEAEGYSILDRLLIDRYAGIILPGHQRYENGVDGEAHRRIGSTGEGVGPCRMAKIGRTTVDVPPFYEYLRACDTMKDPFIICDTTRWLRSAWKVGQSILLEGTQGSGLSLTHGPWPYCTSNDTNAAQLCADAGIPPQHVTDVVLVARTFPIRVAGNSGPLYKETTFQELGVHPEQTTVTGKTRRIGQWDMGLLARAVVLNDPTEIALTFCDYLGDKAEALIEKIEAEFGVPVTMTAWGPDDVRYGKVAV